MAFKSKRQQNEHQKETQTQHAQLIIFDDRKTLPDDVQTLLELNLRINKLTLITNCRIKLLSPKLISYIETGELTLIKPNSIKGYNKERDDFDQIFTNFSSNNFEFERACFLRWIAIEKYASMTNTREEEYVATIDTDFWLGVRLDKDLQQKIINFLNFDLIAEWRTNQTTTSSISPEFTIIKFKILRLFSQFIRKEYFEKVYLDKHRLFYQRLQQAKIDGGICDMRALAEFTNKYKIKKANWLSMKNIVYIDSFNTFIEARKNSINPNFKVSASSEIKIEQAFSKKTGLGVHFQGTAKEYIKCIKDFNDEATLSWTLCARAFPKKLSRRHRIIEKIKSVLKNKFRFK